MMIPMCVPNSGFLATSLLAPSSSVPRTDVPEDQDDHDEEAAIPRARNLRLKLIEIK